MELPMMPVNNTTRMADMTNEEMSTAGNEQMEPSSMTESMTSGEMMTTQTSETNGMAEQLKEITEMSELILEETEL